MPPELISVIVRARNEAGRIERCLDLLSGQRVKGRVETIVVDNGSTDGTGELARVRGAAVLELPRSQFSFGRALNLGAASASGELLVALSADAFLPDERWLQRLADWFEDPLIACASADRYGPDGAPLREPIEQDAQLASAVPQWGYSNAAGGFRAALWRQRGFREDLPGCEDLEWSRHWLELGYRCAVDPGLAAEHDHTHDPLPAIYRRARREAEGLALLAGEPSAGPGLLARWWSDTRFYNSPVRARLSHRRAARLLGERAGRRRARRCR